MAMNLPNPTSGGHFPRSIRMACPTSRRAPSRGFTLVEMLVALAITLIMMGAVVTLFGVIAESVSDSRSGIEMSDRLRAARNQIQLDLQGVTATMKPPLRPENDEGYFEIIEGPLSNRDFALLPSMSLFGDIDDVLMFTTRSRGAPFLGRFNGAIIESPVAEVIYFLAQDVNSPPPVIDATTVQPVRLYTLYRRVLLVTPAGGPWTPPDPEFYDDNEISVRFEEPSAGVFRFAANTLGDLTKRENRFAHYGSITPAVDYGVFPHPVDLSAIPVIPLTGTFSGTPTAPGSWPAARPIEHAFLAPFEFDHTGDDVLLTNVLSFDVQVWDPGAPIFEDSGVAVEPSDPGWVTLVDAGPPPPPPIGFGAYVDLGYNVGNTAGAPNPVFNEINPSTNDGFLSLPTTTPRIYDTWSLHYEADGVDQNGPPGPDAGTNGLDDNANGVVDDITEYDTLPPYSAPLRGIRVTIRVYEPDSQQVREAVVMQSFLPE